MSNLWKRVICVLIGIMVFVLFSQTVTSLNGLSILLGVCLIYTLTTLRMFSTKHYIYPVITLCFLGVISLFFTLDYHSTYSLTDSIRQATFLSFVLLGGPLLFVTMFVMKRQN